MNWGHGIMAAFILFAVYILALVTGCFNQNIDLVAEDYYAQEVVYQTRIHDIHNAEPFADQISVSAVGEMVTVKFPEGLSALVGNGSVNFFRPSDEKMDVMISLANIENGSIEVPLDQFTKGRYEVQIQWMVQDQGYFIKKDLFI
jgi:hypothetical protein